jgi:hypothetical protein
MKNPDAAMRKRLATMPPEVLDALRQDRPPIESRTALLRRRLARCGRGCVGLWWTADGLLAKHVLHKIDKEKA